MKKMVATLLGLLAATAFLSHLTAQPPEGKQKDFSNSPIVTHMMAFNKKNDGKLTKSDVTDPRLHRLFDQADTNKDGVVTREELMALAAKIDSETGGGEDKKGPDSKKGKGAGAKGKGSGGLGGPPRPGQILPALLQEKLNLTSEQKQQLDALQKSVDEKLGQILNDEQKQQLRDTRKNFGPPDGPPKE